MDNDNNKNTSFNQFVNNAQNNNQQLFSNNENNIFCDDKTGMININNINTPYGSNNSLSNEIINASNVQTNIPLQNNRNTNLNNIGSNNLGNVMPSNNVTVENNILNNGYNNSKSDKFNFFRLLTNQKFMLWITVFIFIFTSVTVGKTFYLRSMVDEYEDFFTIIEEKESMETVIYQEEELLDDSLKNIAASEYINCINSNVDINNLPKSITSIVDEINRYYNQSNNYFAFKYKDIYTGFSISYNENQKIFTASTIKAPKDIYIYEMASMGKINLDDKLTYTSGYYNTGSGVLKNERFNKVYDVRTLSKYSIVYSDNAAHNMLMDKYGRKNMLNFWKEKGTNAIFTEHGNWGLTNAHDAVIYMEELYRFYLENEIYGNELMKNFLNANPKFIKGKHNYKVANKSGWSGTAIHDVSIIFADNPYIIVALSNLGNTDYYMSYFNKANDFAYRLHSEYWKYKMSVCGDINQY